MPLARLRATKLPVSVPIVDGPVARLLEDATGTWTTAVPDWVWDEVGFEWPQPARATIVIAASKKNNMR
jgi:hypothetical protein